MASPVIYGSAAGVSLVLAMMPAMACPRQVAAPANQLEPRLRVIATSDGFAIATKGEGPAPVAPRRAVPLGAQLQIDRNAFACSAHRFASALQ